MIISQGTKKFESLENAKKRLKSDSTRVAIHGEKRVVTVRPQIVQSFPGSVEQLFELGMKLGGHPLELFKVERQACEDRDATKEFVIARTLVLHDWLWEQKYGEIMSQLTIFLKRTIEEGSFEGDIKQYETVRDFIATLDSSTQGLNAIQSDTRLVDVKSKIDSLISDTIGIPLSIRLRVEMTSEMHLWLNDPHSPYFAPQLIDTEYLPPSKLYLTLLKHPDLQKLHEEKTSKVYSDFLDQRLALVLYNQKQEEHFTGRGANKSSLLGEQTTPDIFDQLNDDQKKALLTLYFAKMNPIKIIQEAMVFASFSEHLLSNQHDELPPDYKNEMGEFFNGFGDLQELFDLFSENPNFQMQLLDEMMEEEMLEEMLEELEEDDEERDFEELQEIFDEHILLNDDLSLRDKGILAYALFANYGNIDLDYIADLSSVSKQTIRKSIKKLEDYGYINICLDCDDYHMNLELIDAEYLCTEVYEPFLDVLERDDLSWEAKAIFVWSEIKGADDPEEVVIWSTDRLSVVKKAYKELMDADLMFTGAQIADMKEHIENRHRELRVKVKEDTNAWYVGELKGLLKGILAASTPSTNLLNARYPNFENMLPIQVAVVADDPEIIQRLLDIKGIHIPRETVAETLGEIHPLMLAFEMESLQVIPVLLKREEFSRDLLLIRDCFEGIIERRASATCLVYALQYINNERKQGLVDYLLVSAVFANREDYASVLLDAGASPYAPLIEGEQSAMQFVIEHDLHTFVRLFNELAG